MNPNDGEELIPKHGGYRNLKSFQIARLIYDVTVRFCDRYIDHFSRTKDQMIQAARSGVQNIAEGSRASGTSKKTELKLTNVARSSLEELRLDYEDFLRQRGLVTLRPDHPAMMRFKARKPQTVEAFAAWVAQERRQANPMTVPVRDGLCKSLTNACLAANGALSLLNLACHLLDRQIDTLAKNFQNYGGFTERLYRHRVRARIQSATRNPIGRPYHGPTRTDTDPHGR